jgi:hypothetical protein
LLDPDFKIILILPMIGMICVSPLNGKILGSDPGLGRVTKRMNFEVNQNPARLEQGKSQLSPESWKALWRDQACEAGLDLCEEPPELQLPGIPQADLSLAAQSKHLAWFAWISFKQGHLSWLRLKLEKRNLRPKPAPQFPLPPGGQWVSSLIQKPRGPSLYCLQTASSTREAMVWLHTQLPGRGFKIVAAPTQGPWLLTLHNQPIILTPDSAPNASPASISLSFQQSP